MKTNMKHLSLLCMLLFSAICTFGQQTLTGSVTDENGDPLIGATVVEVGNTSNGAITDMNGNFTIAVDSEAEVQISYVGHETTVFSSASIGEEPLALPSSNTLDEVVVTALGITREKASLTYSVQEVGGSTLVQARENNLANAFSGKVSGLQVVRGSNGPASSSKLVLRGMSSLTNDNQPLIVVDGIPMDNFVGADNNDFWNASLDMGSGLGDLNPEDIESISVLKGGAAAALYGSRAGNGVILVTTKKGKATQGLGINFSSTYGAQSLFMEPEYQTSFGRGSQGIYDPESNTTSSWGPAIEGQSVTSWDGSSTAFVDNDNLDNYLRTGESWNNSLSFSQRLGESSSLYSSVSMLDDKSMLPGADYSRLNITTRGISSFGQDKSWTTDLKVQYINSEAQNRPINGHPSSVRNTAAAVFLMPRTVDIAEFKDATDEDGNMYWYTTTNALNPYWGVNYNLNNDKRDRFMLSGNVSNQITDWLTAKITGGADLYTTNTEGKVHNGGPVNATFSVGKNTFTEKNFSGMLTATQDNWIGNFGASMMLGGNLMHRKGDGVSASTSGLEVPNFFSIGNSVGTPNVNNWFNQQKINSLYGQVQLNYDQFFFVDVTGRNDWSSTLSEENRSFFYPSVSSSFLFSDLMQKNNSLPEWLDLGKIRFSYAEVGNSLGPYELYNSYWIGQNPLGITTAGTNNVLFNPDIQNELIKTIEVGAEGRFFENRLGVDFTWYKSNAINQLINLPLNPLSGYSAFKANAGDIQNKGIELMLDANIVRTENFNWSTNVNLAQNENLIVDLTDDVNQITFLSLDNMAVVAVKGEEYGQIWGSKYMRVEDEGSPFYGQKVLDADGLPLAAEGRHLLGDQNPDAVIGWTNTFNYKGFTLGALLDSRIGGNIFSGTNHQLKSLGLLNETAMNGREDFIVEGVVMDDNGNYTENTTPVSPQLYWQAISGRSGNLGINEENVYDATTIRIRNLYLNYNAPKSFAEKVKMQNLKLGVSVNNLVMLDSNLNGIDPESVYATGTNAFGYESLSSPTSTTVFFNIATGF